MPNRIIKESICTSDNLDKLTPEEEVLFYRLIVNCDDYGRLDARPTVLRSKCFPLRIDTIKDSDINKWLKALVDNGLILVYSVNGSGSYIQVITWENHQQVRSKRSKYPAPDDKSLPLFNDNNGNHLITDDNNGNHLITDDTICPRNPIQSNPYPNPYPNPNAFDSFWLAYPKKKSKGQAEKAFNKINPDSELLDKMLAAVENAKKSAAWKKDNGQFIPYPATWLNAKGWEDEIDNTEVVKPPAKYGHMVER